MSALSYQVFFNKSCNAANGRVVSGNFSAAPSAA
jgi:hypothetical protein